MKKNLLLAALLSAVCLGLNVRMASARPASEGSENRVAASTNAAVIWPDYHGKGWVPNDQIQMVTSLSYQLKDNSFVVGPGQFNVLIGTVSYYFDAAEPEQATTEIIEGDILGNGPVVRRLALTGIGWIDYQVRVNGRWQSMPKDSTVNFKVIDEDSVISKNTMAGVIVVIADKDKKVLAEYKFYNKLKTK